ncbi:MAG: YicC/YloC family endoribonuclease, partial [Candidatus Omnitrophota bacterium]
IKRGKVNLSVVINNNTSSASHLTLDEDKVSFYVKSLKKVGKKFGIKGEVEMKDLLKLPDLFVAEQKKINSHTLKRCASQIIAKAIHNLNAMRIKEGAHIARDMRLRLGIIERGSRAIERLVKREPQKLRQKLLQRIAEVSEGVSLASDHLEEHIAYLVDKSDVTEEVVRLSSHVKAARSCLQSGGESGKRLEFIAQEMNREVNTLGAKSQNSSISQSVIALKLEIEKIREQVQNIE